MLTLAEIDRRIAALEKRTGKRLMLTTTDWELIALYREFRETLRIEYENAKMPLKPCGNTRSVRRNIGRHWPNSKGLEKLEATNEHIPPITPKVCARASICPLGASQG